MTWVIEKSPVGAMPRYYESRVAGEDRITAFLGDEEGVIARDLDGEPQENGYGPLYTMLRDDEWWEYTDGYPHATLTDIGDRAVGVPDIRSFGLSPTISYDSLDRAVFGGSDSDCKYTENRKGDLLIVSRTCGASVTRWELNPKAGHLPTRITVEEDGQILHEMRISLARFSNMWFPEIIESRKGGYVLDGEPYEVIHIFEIEPDPEGHPSRFSPADIRVDVGLNIIRRNSDLVALPTPYKWDGEKPITFEEYAARGLRSGPLMTQTKARLKALEAMRKLKDTPERAEHPAIVAVIESDWEAYTRRFIARFRLDEAQTQRAVLLLDQARAEAIEFGVKNRNDLDALATEQQTIQKLTEPERGTKAKDWDARRRKLITPLDNIFDNRLVPDLEKLPTRAQRSVVRAAATARPTSQPATQPK